MRKNGVNRELLEIDGGVCAPSGFSAGASYGGFSQKNANQASDLALILSQKPCSTAFVGSVGASVGEPVKISAKHVKNGKVRAILINSGVAVTCGERAFELSKNVCYETAKRLKLDREQIVFCSTGEIGTTLSIDPFLIGLKDIYGSLGETNEHSLSAARAIMTTDKKVKQVSYSFALGDITCKIGAIFKGNARVAPNMATTLCVLTTDVNVSPEMLQKALNTAVNETLNMLKTDGVPSMNDCVCIMANGEAKNWRLDTNDTEYKKFVYALCAVMDKICREIIADDAEEIKPFVCKIRGMRSKQVARELGLSIVSALPIKIGVTNGSLFVDDLLSVIANTVENVDFENLFIQIKSTEGMLALFENGRLVDGEVALKRIISGNDVEVCLNFAKGNYSATSYGRGI